MKNKLTDLNNHLFAQLERLNDEDGQFCPEEEAMKAKAISSIAGVVVNIASLALKAEKYKAKGELTELPASFKDGL